VERILILFVNAGRKTRGQWHTRSREQDDKINILIQSQMETTEQIKSQDEKINILIQSQIEATEQIKAMGARHDKDMVELRESQKLTDKALRAFINSLHKGRNGESSN
jgi:ribonucleotide monophosphatase NagD (HAD superfamily)